VPKSTLHRYLEEFDFCYSNRVGLGVDDVDRVLKGIVGKRLAYQQLVTEGLYGRNKGRKAKAPPKA
jgi:hypothetical protein